MKVVLPEHSVPREQYHAVYVRYIINLFRQAGCRVTLDGIDLDGRFEFSVDGKTAFMDYSDHPTISNMWDDHKVPYFKFHCHENHIRQGIHPFPPISFYDWKQQGVLFEKIKYTAQGPYVVCKQKPYGNALERRRHVQHLLKVAFKSNAVIEPHSPQEDFWKLINQCHVAVFVPGCYNFMVDRGHIQYMAFGCCTISPFLRDWFPFNKELIPGEHYVECKWDYSNLIERVKWCIENPYECIRIGKNAKQLFLNTCTPDRVLTWIQQNIQ